jgi:thioredoxin 1
MSNARYFESYLCTEENSFRKSMLYTNLNHIETASDYARIIRENENVLIICGKMDPICIPFYGIAEELENVYQHVRFFDLEFDNPESLIVREMKEVNDKNGIPLAVYYKNGNLVNVTAGIQTKNQVQTILDKEYSVTPSSFEVKSKVDV